MKNENRLLPALVFLLMMPSGVFAQDWKNIEINGFLMGNFAGRTAGSGPPGDEEDNFLLSEERLRLNVNAWSDTVEASMRIKTDFLYDNVIGTYDTDIREAYIDYSAGDLDFRLGRQIVTWGVGDLLFINDIFPKDWVSFYSGRPLEYLKLGVDGFRARYSSNMINAELVATPFFRPDNLPESNRFFLSDPFAGIAGNEHSPSAAYDNTELALRLYGNTGNFDISLYGYRGFWRAPSLAPDSFTSPTRVTKFYSKLAVFGFSAQGSSLGGVVSFEAGYYSSLDDKAGNDPSIPNSLTRFLAGYQRQLWEDFTLGVQYYGEITDNYSAYKNSLPAGFPVQKKFRDIATLRLEQKLMHQTWKLSLFTFYGLVENDYLLRPTLSYRLSDDLSATLGANIFGGESDTTFFGQLDRNDNVYLSVRNDF